MRGCWSTSKVSPNGLDSAGPMNRRTSQALALLVSSLVALGIYALARPWILDREPAGLGFHRIEQLPQRDVAQPVAELPAGASAEDPLEPEHWHYYLSEDIAD